MIKHGMRPFTGILMLLIVVTVILTAASSVYSLVDLAGTVYYQRSADNFYEPAAAVCKNSPSMIGAVGILLSERHNADEDSGLPFAALNPDPMQLFPGILSQKIRYGNVQTNSGQAFVSVNMRGNIHADVLFAGKHGYICFPALPSAAYIETTRKLE